MSRATLSISSLMRRTKEASLRPLHSRTLAAASSSSKTITIQAPDFQLTVNPASVVIAKGSATTLTITVTAVNGFTGTINLSATTQPANKHPPTLSPINSVTLTATNPTGTTSLTISTSRATNSGTYTVTITGTAGTTTHNITATVTVTSK